MEVTSSKRGDVAPLDSRRRRFVVLGTSVVLCGALIGIARSQVLQFKRHNTHVECKATLKAWYLTQKAFHDERGRYDPAFANVSFLAHENGRYSYFAGTSPTARADGTQEAGSNKAQVTGVTFWWELPPRAAVSVEQLPSEVRAQLGLSGTCPRCEITAACAANLDDDDTLDVWVVSTGSLAITGPEGSTVSPGMHSHWMDDLDDS
ncbi:hypothetical protein [Myxococcus sp. CA039A]|uniref:hypothetical protein n=1 Tax=Myxococcus sp. CA039A TaxID=2741737 RepID=UPI00157B22AE|nr:hypothetical protein [Myxococcus sp. CA039A]NTX53798.1 hypothetical protein [Myxococcus sp. CA039A]